MDKEIISRETKPKTDSLSDFRSKGYNNLYPIISDNPFKTTLSNNSVKVDLYKIKDKYLQWKEKTQSGISKISTFNFDLLKI